MLDIPCAVDLSENWYKVFLSKYNVESSSYVSVYVITSDDVEGVNITQNDVGVRIDFKKTLYDVNCTDEGTYACGIAVIDMNGTERVKQLDFSVDVDGKFVENCLRFRST